MDKQEKEIVKKYDALIATQFRTFVKEVLDVLDKKEIKDPVQGKAYGADKDDKVIVEQAQVTVEPAATP